MSSQGLIGLAAWGRLSDLSAKCRGFSFTRHQLFLLMLHCCPALIFCAGLGQTNQTVDHAITPSLPRALENQDALVVLQHESARRFVQPRRTASARRQRHRRQRRRAGCHGIGHDVGRCVGGVSVGDADPTMMLTRQRPKKCRRRRGIQGLS